MKRITHIIAGVLVLGVLVSPIAISDVAHAEQIDLQCSVLDGEFAFDTNEGCDLSVIKEVSVNGGAFVAADSADAAASAHIGDTLTWRITVTNTSIEGALPFGLVTVHDVVPSALVVTNVTTTDGLYSINDWVLDINDSLPATLTVTTTAPSVGLFQNTASFTDYNPNNCGDNQTGIGLCVDPPYADADSSNNTDSAFVNVTAVPVVTPAVPHTGLGTSASHATSTLAVFGAFAALATAGALVSRRFMQK